VLLFRGVLVGFSQEEFGRGEPVQGVLLGRSVDPDEKGDTIHAMLLKRGCRGLYQAPTVLSTAGTLRVRGDIAGDLFM